MKDINNSEVARKEKVFATAKMESQSMHIGYTLNKHDMLKVWVSDRNDNFINNLLHFKTNLHLSHSPPLSLSLSLSLSLPYTHRHTPCSLSFFKSSLIDMSHCFWKYYVLVFKYAYKYCSYGTIHLRQIFELMRDENK